MKHTLIKTLKTIIGQDYLSLVASVIRDEIPMTYSAAKLAANADIGVLNITLVQLARQLEAREKVFDREEVMSGLIVWEYIADMISEGQENADGVSELAVKLANWSELHGAYECRERAINLGVRIQRAWDKFLKPYDDNEQDNPLCNATYDFEIVPRLVAHVSDELTSGSQTDADPVKDATLDDGFAQLVKMAGE